jgi:pyruvate formate lyase activating enzyme
MEKRRPLIAEIKRNSLDDGPGIRSVVFFKGCPLSCVWCHNPECIGAGPELIYREAQCIGCRTCAKVCPEKAIPEEAGPAAMDRDKCTLCGECVTECPSGALSIVGKYYTPDELVEALARDQAFYDNSGGGVTLSGGEPTLALDYTAEVAKKLKERGIQVLIETCGDFDWDRFKEKLLPYVDLVFVDMKLCAEDLHKKFTKRDNTRIKQNIERLIARSAPPALVRVPLVPEVTATRENLEAIAAWMRGHGLKRIALLPYNPLWLQKARGLGQSPAYRRDTWMSKEEREEVKRIFEGFEIERDI